MLAFEYRSEGTKMKNAVNIADVSVLAVIAVVVVLVIMYMVRRKKQGGSCAGCSSNCSGASSGCGCHSEKMRDEDTDSINGE